VIHRPHPCSTAVAALSAAMSLTTVPPAAAQADGAPFQVDLIVENDSTFNPDREDRHYTSGQALVIGLPSTGLAGWMDDTLGLPADRAAFGFAAAYQLYTPDRIFEAAPDPGDHPYAAVFTVGGFLQRDRSLGRGVREFDHLQLDLGLVGESARGKQVQEAIHDVFGGDDPNGWDTQHPDMPVVQLSLRHKWRIPLWRQHETSWADPSPSTDQPAGWELDAVPQLAVSAGTLRVVAEASALARFGFNLPDSYGPGFVDDLPSAVSPVPFRNLSAYAYFGGGARLVGWDTVIDGPLWNDPRYDAESQTLVGLARAGVALGYRCNNWSARAAYGLTFHSDTFTTQDAEQHFATLSLSVTGKF